MPLHTLCPFKHTLYGELQISFKRVLQSLQLYLLSSSSGHLLRECTRQHTYATGCVQNEEGNPQVQSWVFGLQPVSLHSMLAEVIYPPPLHVPHK